jgi:hypothetical protein
LLCEDPNSLLFETTLNFDDENDFIVNKWPSLWGIDWSNQKY